MLNDLYEYQLIGTYVRNYSKTWLLVQKRVHMSVHTSKNCMAVDGSTWYSSSFALHLSHRFIRSWSLPVWTPNASKLFTICFTCGNKYM